MERARRTRSSELALRTVSLDSSGLVCAVEGRLLFPVLSRFSKPLRHLVPVAELRVVHAERLLLLLRLAVEEVVVRPAGVKPVDAALVEQQADDDEEGDRRRGEVESVSCGEIDLARDEGGRGRWTCLGRSLERAKEGTTR